MFNLIPYILVFINTGRLKKCMAAPQKVPSWGIRSPSPPFAFLSLFALHAPPNLWPLMFDHIEQNNSAYRCNFLPDLVVALYGLSQGKCKPSFRNGIAWSI